MIKSLRKILNVFLTLCVLQVSFSHVAYADSSIPRASSLGSNELSFLDKPIAVMSNLLFVTGRYFAGSVALLGAIITLKTIAISIPLFAVALGLMLFPKINEGMWKLGSKKGILPK